MRPAIFCFLLLLTLESCCTALSTLQQAVKPAAGRPDPSQVTRALSELQTSNKRNEPPPDGWLPTLTAQAWQPIFVATVSELKEQQGGKYYEGSGGRRQIFTMEEGNETCGQYSSIFANLFFRALRFTVKGSFTMNGRNMSLVFETLEVRLMWFIKLAIPVKEGSLVRGCLERLRGGKKGTADKFEKRPSVYIWCYADDDVCAAQGTSGSIALWGKAPN
jgi:hypothetical protein